MSIIPKFKLISAADGTTVLYTFEIVQVTNAPQTTIKNTIIEGIRGQGCIVISGSSGSWDLTIQGVFLASDYEAVTTKIDALETAIPAGTKFILTLDKTVSTTYSYNVIRILPIEYPDSFRTDYQEYRITFKANAW